mmetsp:Transcript_34621/g.63282  ORF Transcript_34621/g.63282 Transcript_34621/m.63282 type:complete len:307 (+) Transcript_34621:33-953(+)
MQQPVAMPMATVKALLLAVAICLPFLAESLQLDATADAHLAAKLQQLVQNLPDGPSKELMKSFAICGQCDHYGRYGEAADGGYLTCLDNIEPGTASTHLEAAYSIGVADHDKWAADVARNLKLHVYQLDCTVPQGPPDCTDCTFYRKCARSEDGHDDMYRGQSWTLQEILANTGHANAKDRSLMLKMDIEGGEWPILEVENKTLLSKFNQVIMEFHWLDRKFKHGQYVRAVQNLLQSGFRVTHIHGNNYAGMFSLGGYQIPTCMEVTLTSMGEPRSSCLKDQEYIAGLDRPCNPQNHNELPMAHVP